MIRSMQSRALERWRFQHVNQPECLSAYALTRGSDQLQVKDVYQSTEVQWPYNLITFRLTRGKEEKAISQDYLGIEFVTKLHHTRVQLYDRLDRFQPAASTDRRLEADEFNWLFNVYAEDASSPYYFFDPDTMQDLIAIRRSNFTFNLATADNRILLYTPATMLSRYTRTTLSLNEVLMDEVWPEHLTEYQAGLAEYLNQMQKIFQLLDYKLAIHTQG